MLNSRCQSAGAAFRAAAYDLPGGGALDPEAPAAGVEAALAVAPGLLSTFVPAAAVLPGTGVWMRVPSGVLALTREPSEATSQLIRRSSVAESGPARSPSRMSSSSSSSSSSSQARAAAVAADASLHYGVSCKYVKYVCIMTHGDGAFGRLEGPDSASASAAGGLFLAERRELRRLPESATLGLLAEGGADADNALARPLPSASGGGIPVAAAKAASMPDRRLEGALALPGPGDPALDRSSAAKALATRGRR